MVSIGCLAYESPEQHLRTDPETWSDLPKPTTERGGEHRWYGPLCEPWLGFPLQPASGGAGTLINRTCSDHYPTQAGTLPEQLFGRLLMTVVPLAMFNSTVPLTSLKMPPPSVMARFSVTSVPKKMSVPVLVL